MRLNLALTESEEMLKKTALDFMRRDAPKEVVQSLQWTDTGYTDEIWQKIVAPDSFRIIKELNKKEGEKFVFQTETWAKILYDLAAAYHHWQGSRELLVSLMTPLYFARVASFVNQSMHMSNAEAEKLVEEQAEIFEKQKPYLIKRWNDRKDYT